MKMLLTAIAMMIASPALAQTAPTSGDAAGHAAPVAHTGYAGAAGSDLHAGHDMSGGVMGGMDCCKKGGDGTMACCSKMKAEGKKMACCDKPSASAAPGANSHAGHDMSPKN